MTSSSRSAAIADIEIPKTFIRKPAYVSRANPYVMALCDVAARLTSGESLSVGRDGASDAGSFLEAGVPAVEFGPAGAGHHGPDEWVSVDLAVALPPRARRLHPPPARRPRAAGQRAAGRAARRRRRPGVNPEEPAPRVGRGLLKRGCAVRAR